MNRFEIGRGETSPCVLICIHTSLSGKETRRVVAKGTHTFCMRRKEFLETPVIQREAIHESERRFEELLDE